MSDIRDHIIRGIDGTPADVNSDNRFTVDNFPSSDFKVNIALGLIAGTEIRGTFGVSDVDEGIANEQTIGDGMTGRYPFPSNPAQMTLVSDSVNDTSAGTGARVILIRGNITGNVELFETILLDGTTPVITINSYYRVNSIVVVSVGSGGKNEGIITIKNGTDLLAQINPGINVSRTAIYTLPSDVNGILNISDFFAGKNSSGTTLTHIFQSSLGGVDFTPFEQNIYQNTIGFRTNGVFISAGSDLEATGYADTGTGIARLSTIFELILVDQS